MFTNQFIQIVKSCFETNSYNENVTLTDYYGNSRKIYPCAKIGWAGIGACMRKGYASEVSNSVETNSALNGIYFGSGSTPATKSDYSLESPITSGLTITASALQNTTDGNGKYIYSTDFIVKNTTESEINIYEMGAVSQLPSKAITNVSSAALCYPILFERTVLTEPITIAPGESKLVTYKLTFNQTLNVE